METVIEYLKPSPDGDGDRISKAFPLGGRTTSGGRRLCADRSGAKTVSPKVTDEG